MIKRLARKKGRNQKAQRLWLPCTVTSHALLCVYERVSRSLPSTDNRLRSQRGGGGGKASIALLLSHLLIAERWAEGTFPPGAFSHVDKLGPSIGEGGKKNKERRGGKAPNPDQTSQAEGSCQLAVTQHTAH